MNINDIYEYVDDDMLDTLLKVRKEELYKDLKDDIEIAKIKEEYCVDYEKLLVAIKNIPPHFQNTREGIINALEEYSKREKLIKSHDNEKFYKARFL